MLRALAHILRFQKMALCLGMIEEEENRRGPNVFELLLP